MFLAAFSVVVSGEYLRAGRFESTASHLNLFGHFSLVRLLSHDLLVFLALLFGFELLRLETNLLTEGSSLLDLDFLLLVLQLHLHVEHFLHFLLLLLATKFLELLQSFFFFVLLLVEVSDSLRRSVCFLQELISDVVNHLVGLGSPFVSLVSFLFKDSLHKIFDVILVWLHWPDLVSFQLLFEFPVFCCYLFQFKSFLFTLSSFGLLCILD